MKIGTKLLPAQLAMRAFLGARRYAIPRTWLGDRRSATPCDDSLVEIVRNGHSYLVKLTGLDLGFDPDAWHKYLRETNVGGYCWGNKHRGVPKQILRAVGNSEWQEAIKLLQDETRLP